LGGREELRALGSNIIFVDVNDRDGFVQKEALVSFIEHTGGINVEDGLRLDVQIIHHGVTVSPTHHLYIA
jgi:hypothetical protein